jgi:hypothetical protein
MMNEPITDSELIQKLFEIVENRGEVHLRTAPMTGGLYQCDLLWWSSSRQREVVRTASTVRRALENAINYCEQEKETK